MAMSGTFSIFKYKTVKCSLHKLPAIAKLFLFLPLCIFCLSLTPLYLTAGIITAFIFAALCRFSLHEQITDLKPALYYAVLMYALSVFSAFFENWKLFTSHEITSFAFLPNNDYLRITLRLVLIIQLSAFVFRTTSSLEIREALRSMEKRILSILPFIGERLATQSRFVESVSLFLCFIPEIFTNWSSINLAWKARGGRQGIRKIKTTVFILISVSMEKAALKAKALEARSARKG